jgi:multiple sugar transport system permease protein
MSATTLAAPVPPPTRPIRTRSRLPWHRRRSTKGMLYALPVTVFVAVMFILPLLMVVQMSFSDWTLIGGFQGINIPDNFSTPPNDSGIAYGVLNDPNLWNAIRFTLVYTVIVTVVMLSLALGLALLVQEATRWNGILRTAILVPSALGLASASLLFYGLYTPAYGPINPILQAIGVIDAPIAFLGTPEGALWSTVALIVWRFTGFYMLLLLVGLQGIPVDLYEAARIDGAGRWQIFRSITIPLLRPSLALAVILCVTGSLLAFDQFFILTRGGPDGSTMTLVQLIYFEAFGRQDLGAAAAFSVLVLIALVVLNLVQFRALRVRES